MVNVYKTSTTFLFLKLAVVVTLMAAGIGCVSKGRYDAILTQNRSLSEQSRAQLAEIENLKIHATNTEDLLQRTEEEVAMLEERFGIEQERIAQSESETDALRREMTQSNMTAGQVRIPKEMRERLISLSKRYSSLKFDPETGIAKFDFDILFDSGETELKPDAQKELAEVAALLNTHDASDLRILIAGHTDRQAIARRTPDDQCSTNFGLSTARALAVARELDRHGVKSHRMAIAGFGPNQPIAPNSTARDRRKNRRVELFLTAPDVPIVGWVETTPSVYK